MNPIFLQLRWWRSTEATCLCSSPGARFANFVASGLVRLDWKNALWALCRCTNGAALQLHSLANQTCMWIIGVGTLFKLGGQNFWYEDSVSFQTDVIQLPCCGHLTRALLGLWIFHRLLGGGAFEHSPMISAPGRRREKQKAAFESSRKSHFEIISVIFGSGQNWGHQGSKFQNFPKRFFDNKIVNFTGRATHLTPSCLSR